MMTDSQQHIATLDQLEQLQDQLLVDLEELERRVDQLLREALRLSGSDRKGSNSTPTVPHLAEQPEPDNALPEGASAKGRKKKSRAA